MPGSKRFQLKQLVADTSYVFEMLCRTDGRSHWLKSKPIFFTTTASSSSISSSSSSTRKFISNNRKYNYTIRIGLQCSRRMTKTRQSGSAIPVQVQSAGNSIRAMSSAQKVQSGLSTISIGLCVCVQGCGWVHCVCVGPFYANSIRRCREFIRINLLKGFSSPSFSFDSKKLGIFFFFFFFFF